MIYLYLYFFFVSPVLVDPCQNVTRVFIRYTNRLAGSPVTAYRFCGFGNTFAGTQHEFVNIQQRYYEEILSKTKRKVLFEGRVIFRREVRFSLTADTECLRVCRRFKRQVDIRYNKTTTH